MPVDGLDADDQRVGDVAGGMAFGDQLDDLFLPGGEDGVWYALVAAVALQVVVNLRVLAAFDELALTI